MKLRRSLLAALVIIACGRELPSSTPLGGKLDDGLSEGYTPDRRAQSKDGGEVAASEQPDAGAPDAGGSKEAALDAGATEAGAAEAGAAEAGAAEASAEAAVKWAGEYVGSDLTTTRLRGKPELKQPDDKARTRVEDKGSGRIAIIILNSANGETLCTLNASTRGASATVDRDQDCFSSEEADVSVESGSAELKGDRLILDLRASLKGVAGDEKVEGNIDYHFDGKRQ